MNTGSDYYFDRTGNAILLENITHRLVGNAMSAVRPSPPSQVMNQLRRVVVPTVRMLPTRSHRRCRRPPIGTEPQQLRGGLEHRKPGSG